MKKIIPLMVFVGSASIMMSCQLIAPTPNDSASLSTNSDLALSSVAEIATSVADTIYVSDLLSSSDFTTPVSDSLITESAASIESSGAIVDSVVSLSSTTIESGTNESSVASGTMVSSAEALSAEVIVAESSAEIIHPQDTIVLEASSAEVHSSAEVVAVKPITTNSQLHDLYPPENAFDNAATWTQWISDDLSNTPEGAVNIMYAYDGPKAVSEYTLKGRYDVLKDRLPKSWVLQGSNNVEVTVGDSLGDYRWVTVDERTNITIDNEWYSESTEAEVSFVLDAPVSYDNYRLCVTEVNGSSVVDLLEIEYVEPVVPSASDFSTNSTYSQQYSADNAFDKSDISTAWISSHLFRPGNGPANIQVDYAEPTAIVGYSITGRYDRLKDRLPKNWVLQGSNSANASVNDGLDDIQWVQVDEQMDITVGDEWYSEEYRAQTHFTIENPQSFQHYRLCVTAVNGSSVVDIIEIDLIEPVIGNLTQALNDSGSVSASSALENYPGSNAFDGLTTWSGWISNHVFPGGNASLEYVFESQQIVERYAIRGRYDSLKNRLPKSWVLQGSNSVTATSDDSIDDLQWTEVDAQSGITLGTEWLSDEAVVRNEYEIIHPIAYTHYRLVVTEVNGSTVVDIHELELIGIPVY